MSVSDTVTLPASPATGVLRYVPLGGNGYTDPFAMYTLRNFAVTGDAGGGSSTLTVVMDDRFCSMISYATMITAATATDPHPIRWVLGSGTAGSSPNMIRQERITMIPSTIAAARVSDLWLPPAFLLPGADFSSIVSTCLNEDTDVHQLFLAIFLYNINARQKVPYSHLVQARGGVGSN